MKAAVPLAVETVCATVHMIVILIFTAVRNSDLITFLPSPCSGHNCQAKLVSSIFLLYHFLCLCHATI